MFHGSMVAIVTPMKVDLSIDYSAFTDLIEWHIEQGTNSILVLGTTGESPTITEAERKRLISTAVECVHGRVPVVAGAGTNATQKSIELAHATMQLGVDAVLMVTPYYNRPTQEGLFQHFRTIAKAVPVPQILYNVPSRTGCDLLPETIIRLSTVPNIVAVKDASGDVARVQQVLNEVHDSLDLLSGDDKTGYDFMLAGGKGVISVSANIAPKLVSDMCAAILQQKLEQAETIHSQLASLDVVLGVETNPIPTKWALEKMGKIPSGIRLPLTPLSTVAQPAVEKVLQELKLI